jgi:hypothetical protein
MDSNPAAAVVMTAAAAMPAAAVTAAAVAAADVAGAGEGGRYIVDCEPGLLVPTQAPPPLP